MERFVLVASTALDGQSGHEAGRALLALLYRAHTGEDALPPIVKTQWGKPFFPNSPLHFSISHTPRHAFCALSNVPIGIDAEELDRDIDLRLASKILSPTEARRYEAAPDKRAALLRLWVLKEADAKRSGFGLRGYPRNPAFSPDDPRLLCRDGCVLAILAEGDTPPCSLIPMPI